MADSVSNNGGLQMPGVDANNPVGLNGMQFVEYASPNPEKLAELFLHLGFQKVGTHKSKLVSLYSQGDIHFVINEEAGSFASDFQNLHGPSICATGFRVKNAVQAYEMAISRGARPCEASQHHSFPAIYGIGDSVIYFVEDYGDLTSFAKDFDLTQAEPVKGFGLFRIDHLTNNVPNGQMQQWCDFYESIFNFKETRFFDIQGKETGLVSKVMTSYDKKIIIPINEPSDSKSQIQEYIDEYKGSGIQHVALTTTNICETVRSLREGGVEFLDTPDTYYEALPKRLPDLEEDIDELQSLRVLADGDEKGYLLQIFTQTVIGPIFYEIIQRKNHDGFGEGNFQALFDSIEEDQRRRGML